MSHFKQFRSAICAVFCLLGIGTASAELFDRGGGLIYDSDLNITWQSNANLGATNSFGVSGIATVGGGMPWAIAQSWIAAMNAASYLGYSDWRLPTTTQPDPTCSNQFSGGGFGNGCRGSEMGHLFYEELGGVSLENITTTHNANYDKFSNIQPVPVYWSGTEFIPGQDAWFFAFYDGSQRSQQETPGLSAWAVRSGDVTPIPEPETYAMMLAGLGLLGFMARHRKQ